jgi:CheY-like chemotaxis protein
MSIPKKIYLIDDDEDDRMLLREAMQTVLDDITVCEFDGAFTFYHQMQNLPLKSEDSLILLDMNMPKMDGLELLRELRSDHTYSHIPVVIISTTVNQMIVRETRDLGVEAYLSKPVSQNELTAVAETIRDCYQQHFGKTGS